MKKVVFLSGAGVSKESGINTFRDSGGLWENYNVEEVATLEGWRRNPKLVQQFYNERREQLKNVEPNKAHKLIAKLESDFEVFVVTQNVDDLHERAGSSNVLHLHGELTKASNESKSEVIDIGYRAIKDGEKASDNSRLRPFIVWFGEQVPMMDEAVKIIENTDILVIIGTSLQVYPAASLINFARKNTPIFLIDPNDVTVNIKNLKVIKEIASKGMEVLTKELKVYM
ncbi:MAG: Sir2 family NAD-dependent protein deacetylase [Campylobacteraceae bacterium]